MAEYTISRRYRSARDGQTFGPWEAGDKVELTEVDAEWLERDSPGVLRTPESASVVTDDAEEVARQQPPTPNRQAKPGRNRGA